MAIEINFEDLIKDPDDVESYILFRKIEDWCADNIPKERWRFNYSSAICVLGIDLPGRIIFRSEEDANIFRLVFGR